MLQVNVSEMNTSALTAPVFRRNGYVTAAMIVETSAMNSTAENKQVICCYLYFFFTCDLLLKYL